MTESVVEVLGDATELDSSSRAGIFLSAMALGSSFQPNLLTRGTRDQAIISGLSSVTGYGAATAAHSLLLSVADRLPGSTVVGEIVLTVAGAATARFVPAKEHESDRRAIVRLAGFGTAALGAASLASRIEDRLTRNRPAKARVAISTALVAGGTLATYLRLRSPQMRVGSELPDGSFFEDAKPRDVRPVQAVAIAGGITGALIGFARAESFAARQVSRAAARVFGGRPEDHVTFGRVTVLTTSLFAGRALMNKLVTVLNNAGEEFELAHREAPTLSEVTGGPGSTVPWELQSREGRRWLSMTLLASSIEKVMQKPAKQPIRVYASLKSADSEEQRAEVLMRELERTGAFERKVIALFSPTGSGYVNYVANETLEYLTQGDCASAAIEYSVLPSSFSLLSVPTGTRQTRLVVNAIMRRLYSMKPEDRPRFVMFGESLGSQVSQGLFTDQGAWGPKSSGLDAAVWVGTPSASKWRKQLWGDRTLADAPDVGPGEVYLPRNIADWQATSAEDRQKVRYLLLQNGDDPIPKFGSDLIWKQPDWLSLDFERPLGVPNKSRWIPFITFYQTFIDMLNALLPTPGKFAEGGHDYRVEIPGALRDVWQLSATDEEMSRIVDVMEKRELAWEAARQWESANAKTDPKKKAKAVEKAQKQIGVWLGDGTPATSEQIEYIITHGENI